MTHSLKPMHTQGHHSSQGPAQTHLTHHTCDFISSPAPPPSPHTIPPCPPPTPPTNTCSLIFQRRHTRTRLPHTTPKP